MARRTRVKICCISSRDEARRAIAAGADALGLVSDMPSGPGIISDELAQRVVRETPPPVSCFFLTLRERADAIAEQARACGADTVQVVHHIDPGEYPRLMEAVPNLRRVQVIHVEDASALELIERYAPYVHMFLLDSGRPNAPVAEYGGTGRVHDWAISAEFVRRSPLPVMLAGGLTPENVAGAMAQVAPYGLDLCSGVRTEGALDDAKLGAFMRAVRAAERAA
ncbi:phosphoribosylanthranilate isomerase [Haliangium ochraceum]|uniref:N-(5'-phosphoribosyl)anthranilate isomerase n=1 Tax=Haliangium ochraceum (strain DSM 14365 / JCM 11303 / SMP-2) TaxID=502025 RepID=D0LGB7_HALO1|nr:phosphoribosylanthranilate isomerase [Haliangium ochraceum]ACY18142.1 Phosphoribosylanthranilate isomerase [Haliangium ochraceum DSM 14365]